MKVYLLLTIVIVFSLACERLLQRDDAFATAEKVNTNFKVRISAFREKRGFGGVLGGARYVFETKNASEDKWREFMAYEYDDPIPIDKNSVVLVDDKVGYVFMIGKFAVTTTEGKTWSVWDVSKFEPLRDDLSCRIQMVSVMKDGTGTMNIKCNKSATILSTRDFGVAWNQ